MLLSFFFGSLCLIGQHRYALLKGVALPSIIYLLLEAVDYALSNAGPSFSDVKLLLYVPFLLAEIAIVAVVSITTIRIVLLDERPKIFRFSKRELKYALYYMGFLLAWMIPSSLIGVSTALVFQSIWLAPIPLAFFLVAVFFTLRLSLVLVGVAIDRKISLRDSYVMTLGPQWALFISLAMFSVLFVVFYFFWGLAIGMLESEYFNSVSFFLLWPLGDIFIYVLISVVLANLYSVAYQSGEGEGEGEAHALV
ncbi:hypothetical protein ACUY1T_21370 [Billgrantia sp. Q4P2]|uniref:hypothetical protein n=1 Tax=Billgrantia sp. Q4P2 TaxID=3463857 RepID=UPI00405688A7